MGHPQNLLTRSVYAPAEDNASGVQLVVLNLRVPHPCGFCKGGGFSGSTLSFPVAVESKPPPFENRKGWGTRKNFLLVQVVPLPKMTNLAAKKTSMPLNYLLARSVPPAR